MERFFVGSAVTGRLAAAGLEQVDGALDELALVLGQQGFEGQSQAAGAVRVSGQRQLPFCM